MDFATRAMIAMGLTFYGGIGLLCLGLWWVA